MKNDYEFIDGTRLSSVIEALIFASDEPIPASKVREIIVENEEQIEITEETVQDFVDKLNQRYDENGLSFRIQQLGGGFTFVTQSKYHYWLSVFQHENAYRKLSQSAIESLAIVAYRQPITKPEVDQIRGVDSGYILRQLMEKALIEVGGRADSPGKPLLYKTTKHFLRHFGINSVDELPKPREIDEILKDDDMAEHRQLLMERQLMMDEMEDAEEEKSKEDLAEEIFEEFETKKAQREEVKEQEEEEIPSNKTEEEQQDDEITNEEE
ncbi:MAG TPA: SMC-Scp complex subunit ScpB [Balneolaceae bacterium]|nr:SMC-Scp complex subunit ScpB [Balneola sp.]HBQ59158.1 SMC-Scp complex subunit ScpB [Balneolaceae bacterium]|tara:strand:- start:59983 stop:60786 length:804 start_codon:yes stop_codon:yes gene_type:complete